MNQIRFFLRCKVSTLREQDGRPDRDGAGPVRPYSGKAFPETFSDPDCLRLLLKNPVWKHSALWKSPALSGSAALQQVSAAVQLQKILFQQQFPPPEPAAVSALQQAQFHLPESEPEPVQLSEQHP